MAETDVIRTPDQRLRVFVSSTLQELAAERQAVRDAVTRLRLVPVMFELGARPQTGHRVPHCLPLSGQFLQRGTHKDPQPLVGRADQMRLGHHSTA